MRARRRNEARASSMRRLPHGQCASSIRLFFRWLRRGQWKCARLGNALQCRSRGSAGPEAGGIFPQSDGSSWTSGKDLGVSRILSRAQPHLHGLAARPPRKRLSRARCSHEGCHVLDAALWRNAPGQPGVARAGAAARRSQASRDHRATTPARRSNSPVARWRIYPAAWSSTAL